MINISSVFLFLFFRILYNFIKGQRTNLAEFDESLAKRWLKQITVWGDHFTVELKSGLKIYIEG